MQEQKLLNKFETTLTLRKKTGEKRRDTQKEREGWRRNVKGVKMKSCFLMRIRSRIKWRGLFDQSKLYYLVGITYLMVGVIQIFQSGCERIDQ